MRIVSTAVVILLAAAVVVFCLQNLANVSVSFLGWKLDAPLAIVVAVVYFLGMLSGGWVLAFIRRLIHGATSKPKSA